MKPRGPSVNECHRLMKEENGEEHSIFLTIPVSTSEIIEEGK